MNKTVFKTAPLPFQGQKRRFIGTYSLVLKELRAKKEISVIVDLFGGSGLLSHTAKRIFPDARVIYNDYDNFSQRLLHIEQTNSILDKIRTFTQLIPKGQKLDDITKGKIIDCIEIAAAKGFVDYITLSSSLLFSGKYVTSLHDLRKETLYNNIKVSNYESKVSEYLEGLDVVHCDYKELHRKYKDVPGVLFVVDPPYLSTDTSTYHSDKYWKLRDYLDVLNVLEGTNYFFFSSNKSSLIELCEWFDDNKKGFNNPFVNSVLNTQNVTLNKTSGYTDMMLYKFIAEPK